MRDMGALRVRFDGIEVEFAPPPTPAEEYEVHDTPEDGIVDVAGQRGHDLVKRDSKLSDPSLNDWFRKSRPFQPTGIVE